jgi:hypothetical protein
MKRSAGLMAGFGGGTGELDMIALIDVAIKQYG